MQLLDRVTGSNETRSMRTAFMIIAGLVTGIFSGIFGIGGGVILVPILVFALGMPQHTASGTSLMALLLPVGALGVMEYYRAGRITTEHLKYGTLIAIGLFFGTYFGSKIALHIPAAQLRKAFAILLGGVALKLWFMK